MKGSSKKERRTRFGEHAPDGSDSAGDQLPIVIRILPDGRLYTHDITAAMLPVLMSVCPGDAGLRARAGALGGIAEGAQP